MTNELLKQLRDAGFPVRTQRTLIVDDVLVDEVFDPESVELGALIAACPREYKGDSFDLTVLFDGWYASYQDNDTFTASLVSKGATPIEAVAHLWLALR